jgi:NAD+ kinase
MKIKYRISKDKRAKYINALVENNFPEMITERHPDLIFVPGGDGAILHAIQEFNHLKVPFFGLAAGSLNFLMNEIPFSELTDFLEDLKNDKISIQETETTKIKVTLLREGGEKIKVGQAINEVVIGSSLMGYHYFSVSSSDGSFNNFEMKGSGICISTDLGSTGYNFNLGGAILPLGSDLWSISGIVCNRYLSDILNTKKISIKCLSKKPKAHIYLDGIVQKLKIKHSDTILLQRGDKVKIAFYNKKNFFEKRVDISSRFRKNS